MEFGESTPVFCWHNRKFACRVLHTKIEQFDSKLYFYTTHDLIILPSRLNMLQLVLALIGLATEVLSNDLAIDISIIGGASDASSHVLSTDAFLNV